MLSCKQATELASHALDRHLTLWERMNLKTHLMMCNLCRRYQQQIKFLSNNLQCNTAKPADDNANHSLGQLSKDARSRIKKTLENQQDIESPPSGG